MSVFKLIKYLEEPFEPPINSTHTILLSDSKGSYIQSNFHSLHPSFEFVHRGGARIGDQLCWVLSHRIALVNDIFRSLKQTNSVSSFRFKADLLRTRKVYKCSRTTVNFNLFKDGIHPGTVLAQYWARRFAHRAVLDR